MKKKDFLIKLIQTCLQDGCEDEKVLACMIVLHTHCLKVQDQFVLDDGTASGVLSPLTRRHASEIVAQALSSLGECDDPEYWYMKYDSTTPFEVDADITDVWKQHTDDIQAKMKHAFVSDLWPD